MSNNIIKERVDEANEKKLEGNDFFKSGQYTKAIRKYHYALMYIKDIEKPSPINQLAGISADEETKISKDDEALVFDMRCQCHNNLAACFSKEKKFEKVIDYASKVLDLQPTNAKALFRRADAYVNIKDIEKAENDFLAIKKIQPDDTSYENYLPTIKAIQKERLRKEKDIYKKMMGNGT